MRVSGSAGKLARRRLAPRLHQFTHACARRATAEHDQSLALRVPTTIGSGGEPRVHRGSVGEECEVRTKAHDVVAYELVCRGWPQQNVRAISQHRSTRRRAAGRRAADAVAHRGCAAKLTG